MPKSVYSARYTQFRKLLVDARIAANVTQEELAADLGRPQSYVSKYERGERRLDVVEYLEIALALNIDPAALLEKLQAASGTRS